MQGQLLIMLYCKEFAFFQVGANVKMHGLNLKNQLSIEPEKKTGKVEKYREIKVKRARPPKGGETWFKMYGCIERISWKGD